jgi:hypothetical protein
MAKLGYYLTVDDISPLTAYEFSVKLISAWKPITDVKFYSWPDFYRVFTASWGLGFEHGPFIRTALLWLFREIKWSDVEGNLMRHEIQTPDRMEPISWQSNSFFDMTEWREKPKGWLNYFTIRLQCLTKPANLTLRAWFLFLESLGIGLWQHKPNSRAVVDVKKYLEENAADKAFWKKVDNAFKTLEAICTIGASLIVSFDKEDKEGADGKLNTAVIVEQAAQELAEVTQAVALDNVTNVLDQQRQEAINWAVELDEKTSFDLSSLTEWVAGTTNKLVDAFENGIEEAIRVTIKEAFSKLQDAENKMEPANRQYMTRLEQVEATGGLAVALGFKRLFFEEKET